MLDNLFTDRLDSVRRTRTTDTADGLPQYYLSYPLRQSLCRWWNTGAAQSVDQAFAPDHTQYYAVAVPLQADLQVDDTLTLTTTSLPPLQVEALRRNRTHLEARCRLAATGAA